MRLILVIFIKKYVKFFSRNTGTYNITTFKQFISTFRSFRMEGSSLKVLAQVLDRPLQDNRKFRCEAPKTFDSHVQILAKIESNT